MDSSNTPMDITGFDDEIHEDPETIEYYVGEVKKNISQRVEKTLEDRFLHSSLRCSERLKAIEQYQRVIHPGVPDTYAVNEGYEDDETLIVSLEELEELIKYLKTKVSSQLSQVVSVAGESMNKQTISTDSDQWKWLLDQLSDPLTANALLMHNRVVNAYCRCRDLMENRRREEWPVLPGLALDTLWSVKNHLMTDYLQHPFLTDSNTLRNAYSLYKILASSKMKNCLAAVDGLANTWLSNVHSSDADSLVNMQSVGEDSSGTPVNAVEDESMVMSAVPGCYSIVAYDDKGRSSCSTQGVRLRYVILHKGNNEYIGATVRIENRSVIVARIVSGGVAQKTNLLHEGDEILSVNDVELLGKDLATVCNIMAEMQGKIVLLVAPVCEPSVQENTDAGIINLRALFTYDPDEDSYLACKPLGLPFIKGDIIHVTGRADPNWWQAYRRNSGASITGATGTLAGLIPSPYYQFQRTSIQLRYRLEKGSEDLQLEDVPEDLAEASSDQPPSKPAGLLRRLFKSDRVAVDKLSDSGAPAGASPTDRGHFPLSSGILAPVYMSSTRPSGAGSTAATSASLTNIWSDAGVVWGQHGNEMSASRVKRSGTELKKRNRKYLSVLRSLPANQGWQENQDDPVAWLDDAVASGYMLHSSLWTYEPVTQYLPQPLRRRPLVFIGPVYIGRHQIMQGLIKTDSSRFLAAAIHTTNTSLGENSPTPYKLVSEEAFEEMRKEKNFIEWGVYNKLRYGTAIDTVASIIKDGKVCCITLRPDSLRVIRSLGFKPYVIFISPPERADDLRRIQGQLGLKYEFGDVELKECIETSRQMEVRYGHWFDSVIVPETMESTLHELQAIAYRLEREPSWVPRQWMQGGREA